MKVITFLEVVTQFGAKTKLVGRMNSLVIQYCIETCNGTVRFGVPIGSP